jgi:Holliday junction resolvase RusA-like endonuclease
MQTIIIPGRPATKKNSQQILINRRTHRPFVSQSDTYKNYEESCLWYLRKYKQKYTGLVHVQALYWMPNKRSWPDLIGLLQATCDILQKAGIIVNDRFVDNFDGSRIVGVDRDNPRCEIRIAEVNDNE